MVNGFGKLLGGCSPTLLGGVTPQAMPSMTTTVVASLRCVDGIRVGLLPDSFYSSYVIYGNRTDTPFGLIARSAKPEQRDRLALNRYDEQDFTEVVSVMKADGLWFL